MYFSKCKQERNVSSSIVSVLYGQLFVRINYMCTLHRNLQSAI